MGHTPTAALGRRSLLHGALVTGAAVITGMHVNGCSAPAPRPATQHRASPSPAGRAILLAYFSRAGENYHYGGRTRLAVGNTEVLARMISRHIECDVHRVLAADPYPDDYSQTVERNVREQDTDARPAIEGPLPSIDRYDTVLLGSPIWNVRAPMIMSTFTEGLDFRGKTVIPFTTHAMSGLGTTARDYAASCPGATFAEGLAVRGEQVNNADAEVQPWLERLGLLASSP
jgi:flavodoxin